MILKRVDSGNVLLEDRFDLPFTDTFLFQVVPVVTGHVAYFAYGQAAMFGLALAFWGGVRLLHRLGRRDCGE